MLQRRGLLGLCLVGILSHTHQRITKRGLCSDIAMEHFSRVIIVVVVVVDHSSGSEGRWAADKHSMLRRRHDGDSAFQLLHKLLEAASCGVVQLLSRAVEVLNHGFGDILARAVYKRRESRKSIQRVEEALRGNERWRALRFGQELGVCDDRRAVGGGGG